MKTATGPENLPRARHNAEAYNPALRVRIMRVGNPGRDATSHCAWLAVGERLPCMPIVHFPIARVAARTGQTCRRTNMPVPSSHHTKALEHGSATHIRSWRAVAAVGLTGALCSLVAWLSIEFGGGPDQAVLPQLVPWLREGVLALALGGPVGLLALVVACLRSANANELEALRRESHQRRGKLQVLDLLPLPVALCGANHEGAQINRAMAELLGVERGDGLDLPWDWQGFVIAEDWPAWAGAMEVARQTRQTQWLHARVQTGDAEMEVLAQIASVGDAHAADAALAVVLRLAEDAVAQQAIFQLRELLEMAEAEKWLFGQAVHDELGQRLSGIAYFAKTLQRKLEVMRLAEADDAGWLTSLANESMAVARGLSRGLVPVGTDDPGALAATLAELCQNTSKMFGAHCTLQADADFDAGGAARANHLYHAVQELITNAIKHGAASNVQVRLEVHAGGQRVCVRNDGRGLPAGGALPRGHRMGLNGVRSRVAHLGGQFALADEAGGGVLASIELPIQHGAVAAPDATAQAIPVETPAAPNHREDA